MNNLKKIMLVAFIGAMGFGAFAAYNHVNVSNSESVILENVEALTNGELDKNCGALWGEGCYANNYGVDCFVHTDCN